MEIVVTYIVEDKDASINSDNRFFKLHRLMDNSFVREHYKGMLYPMTNEEAIKLISK